MGEKMNGKRRKNPYSTLKIPMRLVESIDAYLNSDGGRLLGYTSRADLVTKITRDFLEKNIEKVEIPIELVKEVDRIISTRTHGYTSKEEFIKDAIRRRLDELKKSPLK
jgi:metal-responsive CopG/Arc/MetJ family transcriptional regulator